MKILIVEDSALVVESVTLAFQLQWADVELVSTAEGKKAIDLVESESPDLVLLDVGLPDIDGYKVLEAIREFSDIPVIMLTARDETMDKVKGLELGADDYVTKPFDHGELRARVQVGARVVGLQRTLAERVHELEEAMNSVKTLQGLLPICCYCKKIRDDGNYWHRVESYIAGHANVRFSHGICPECSQKVKAELNL